MGPVGFLDATKVGHILPLGVDTVQVQFLALHLHSVLSELVNDTLDVLQVVLLGHQDTSYSCTRVDAPRIITGLGLISLRC